MKNLARNLLGAFVLVGIVAACSSTDPYVDQATVNIYTQNFDSAYAILDRQIAETPENGTPYYYKALAKSEEARTIEDPNNRKPVYRDFRENIVTSREMFAAMEEAPGEAGEVDNLVLNTWGREHNAGLEYATNDSLMATVDQPLQIAIAHFQNATIVNPDSTLSFDVLGQVYLMANDYEGAAVALQDAIEMKDPAPADDYDRLSAILVNLQRYEESIVVLEEALELYPDTVSLSQKLADVYMQTGDRDRSISVLEDLLETDPNNAQYHLALGTQILQATNDLSGEIEDSYNTLYDLRTEMRDANEDRAAEIDAEMAEIEQDVEELEQEIQRLGDEAEDELSTVLELRPNDIGALNALGILYQNRAAANFEKRNYTNDLEESQVYDERAKEQLRTAMGYYEQIVEIDETNVETWRALVQVYTTLGMNEKAQEALDKAGM